MAQDVRSPQMASQKKSSGEKNLSKHEYSKDERIETADLGAGNGADFQVSLAASTSIAGLSAYAQAEASTFEARDVDTTPSEASAPLTPAPVDAQSPRDVSNASENTTFDGSNDAPVDAPRPTGNTVSTNIPDAQPSQANAADAPNRPVASNQSQVREAIPDAAPVSADAEQPEDPEVDTSMPGAAWSPDKPMQAELAENTASGTTAFDLPTEDIYGNSIQYELTDAFGEPLSGGFFELNGTTIVTTDQSLSFEQAQSHTLYLTATTENGVSGPWPVNVTVQDVAEDIVLDDTGLAFVDEGVAEHSITGGDGNDTITGHDDGGTLDGGAGDDQLSGGAADDLLTGGAGDDTLNGGGGTDVAVFTGDWSDYTITESSGFYTVTDNRPGSPDGTDRVEGVEVFRFADGDVSVADALNDGPSLSVSDGTVTENGAGAVVGAVSATDPDAGDTVTLSVDDARFEVVGGQLKLKDGERLDFEDGATVSVTVTATDAHGATDSQVVTVTVDDVAEAIVLDDDGSLFVDSGVAETSITGGDGADTITGHDDGSLIDGGAGNDIIDGGAGYSVIDGGVGDDQITVGDDGSYADGGAGNDTVTGGGGDDVVSGNDGHDVISGGGGADDLAGNDGDDTIDGGVGNDTLYGGDGDDLLSGGAGDDSLYGGDGFNELLGDDGNDLITGGDDGNIVEGGAGDDTISGGADADDLYGGADNDVISGGAGTDLLSGNDGDDTLDGGDGNDTLFGGEGADVLTGGAGDDVINGGDGSDVAVFTGDWSDYTITESGGVFTVVDKRAGSPDGTDRIENIDIFRFSDGDRTATDALNDAPEVTAADGSVAENSAGAVVGAVSSTDADAGDSVTYSVDDARFEVVGGQLKLKDGERLDFEDADSVAVTVTATDVHGATDSQVVTVSVDDLAEDIQLGDGGESFTDTGVAETSITGGDGADTITGHDDGSLIDGGGGEDFISGKDGNDSIYGGSLADYLSGNDGDDTLDGGDGDDTLYGDAGDDVLDAGEEANVGDDDQLFGGAGNDTLTSSETDSRSEDYFDGGTGNDVITSQGGDDTLVGGTGDDTLSGGTGDDVIQGGDDTDTAEWSGDLADFSISYDTRNETFTVTDTNAGDGDEGTDTVTGVETFTFNGVNYAAADIIQVARDQNEAPENLSTNLLDNGSFDDGLEGWSNSGAVQGRTRTFSSSDDTTHAQFGASNQDDGQISQTFETVVGETYSLTFDYGASGPRWSQEITVTVEGASTLVSDSVLEVAGSDIDYQTYTYTFVADSTSTTLTFDDTSYASTNRDAYLNDVSVVHETAVDDGTTEATENAASGTIAGIVDAFDPEGNEITYVITDSVGNEITDSNFEIVGSEIRVRDGAVLDFESAESHEVYVVAYDGLESGPPTLITVNVADAAEAIQLADGGVTFTDTGVAETSITGGDGADNITAHDDGSLIHGGAGGDQLTGGTGSDTMSGGDGFNIIDGNGGDDVLTGGNDGNVIDGGDGNDTVMGGSDADFLFGEDGDDFVSGSAGDDTLRGGSGNDELEGSQGDDVIRGESGEDTATWDGDFDDYAIAFDPGTETFTIIDLNAGDGEEGTDTVNGVETFRFNGVDYTADQLVTAAATYNYVVNGSFEDVAGGTDNGDGFLNATLDGWTDANGYIFETHNSSHISGLAASDGSLWLDLVENNGDGLDISQSIAGLQGGEAYALSFDAADILGSSTNLTMDVYFGGELVGSIDPTANRNFESFNFELVGGSGDGSNTLRFVDTGGNSHSGLSLDNIEIVHTPDTTFTENRNFDIGMAETATYDGTTDPDAYTGTGSSDVIYGREGQDTLDGAGGDDTIYAGSSNDSVEGGSGEDVLFGGDGFDTLSGGAGNDTLYGDAGDDYLSGGTGDDFLAGGDGNDIFNFASLQGNDTVDGGDGWTDVIELEGFSGGYTVTGDTIEGDGWTAMIDAGDSVTGQTLDSIELSADATGVITFDDGGTIDFSGIERIVF